VFGHVASDGFVRTSEVGKGKATESSFNLQSPSHDVSRRSQVYRRSAESEMGEVECEAW
jgi:hypothetical protein